jgi:hypothetical protein
MEEACQARSIEIRKQEVSYDVRQATVDFFNECPVFGRYRTLRCEKNGT